MWSIQYIVDHWKNLVLLAQMRFNKPGKKKHPESASARPNLCCVCVLFRNPWVLLSMPSGILETCLQQEKIMTFTTVSLISENLEQLKEQDFLASKDTVLFYYTKLTSMGICFSYFIVVFRCLDLKSFISILILLCVILFDHHDICTLNETR